MTSTEIVRSYKEAKSKPQQIRILADLNACDMETIREVLRHGGIPAEELETPTERRGRRKKAEQPAREEPTVTLIEIPRVAREACEARLRELNVSIMELTGEKAELERFLEGRG